MRIRFYRPSARLRDGRDTEVLGRGHSGPLGLRRRSRHLVAVAMVPLLALVLSACGSSSSESKSAGNGGGSGGGGSTLSQSQVAEQLKEFLNPSADGPLGGGKTWKVGLSTPETGPAAPYGELMRSGVELAAEQITAMGGPTIELVKEDNVSNNTQSGPQNMRAFQSAGVGAAITANIGNLGSQLPLAKDLNILLLDPGGGSGGIVSPYFYGTRSSAFIDVWDGLFKYVKEAYPEAKKVVFIGDDLGPATNKVEKSGMQSALAKNGLTLSGFVTNPTGTSDFSSLIPNALAGEPDIIVSGEYGTDTSAFIRQAATRGVTQPVFELGYTPGLAEEIGSAAQGYTLASDFFVPTSPTNEWAKVFVKAYNQKFGHEPGNYAAFYYETMFALWQWARVTLKEGGNIQSGKDLLAALEAKPSYPSVIGESSTGKTGVTQMSLSAHTPEERPLGIYTLKGETWEPKAYFGLHGKDYRPA